jgi:hypothetical protein
METKMTAEELVNRLAENQLRFNWPRFEPSTKRRILRQFGYIVDSEEVAMDAAGLAERGFRFPQCDLRDPAYHWPTQTVWTVAGIEEIFEAEKDAIEAACDAMVTDWGGSYVLELAFDPSRNAVKEYAAMVAEDNARRKEAHGS